MTYKIHQEISPKIMRKKQDVLKREILSHFENIKGLEIDVERNTISWNQGCGVLPNDITKLINKL